MEIGCGYARCSREIKNNASSFADPENAVLYETERQESTTNPCVTFQDRKPALYLPDRSLVLCRLSFSFFSS